MERREAFRTATAIVPVFNGCETLAQCLESLHRQGEGLTEIIAIDDSSWDVSPKILREFAAKDSRFNLVRHDRNQGLSRTLNEGLARATGDAVLIIQQDCELLGSDWVQRGLAFLGEHQTCSVSGSPEYSFRDMSHVDVAFGMLRDTFFKAESNVEELAFSEFKCDLVPRGAMLQVSFDTRFRISGEDQIASANLRSLGHRILRFRELEYVQRSGNTSSVIRQLRKEMVYGKTESGILLTTSLRIAFESSGSATSRRRLVNRGSAVLSASAFLAFLALVLLSANPLLWLLPLPIVMSRGVLVASRRQRVHQSARLPNAALAQALLIMPVADLLYSASFLSGFLAFAVAERV